MSAAVEAIAQPQSVAHQFYENLFCSPSPSPHHTMRMQLSRSMELLARVQKSFLQTAFSYGVYVEKMDINT